MVENASYVYFVLLHKAENLRSQRNKYLYSNYHGEDREFMISYYSNRIKEIESFILKHFPKADLGDFRFSE